MKAHENPFPVTSVAVSALVNRNAATDESSPHFHRSFTIDSEIPQ
jgi:hypothetical protein